MANPRLEAEILLAHVLDKPRTHLFAWPENRLNVDLWALNTSWNPGSAASPVLTSRGAVSSGHWVKSNPGYTHSAAGTEILVTRALQLIPVDAVMLADLGTGSGAIGAAIAYERPACHILATDISEAALAVANDKLSSV